MSVCVCVCFVFFPFVLDLCLWKEREKRKPSKERRGALNGPKSLNFSFYLGLPSCAQTRVIWLLYPTSKSYLPTLSEKEPGLLPCSFCLLVVFLGLGFRA